MQKPPNGLIIKYVTLQKMEGVRESVTICDRGGSKIMRDVKHPHPLSRLGTDTWMALHCFAMRRAAHVASQSTAELSWTLSWLSCLQLSWLSWKGAI